MSVHMPTVPEKKDRRVALVVVDAQNKFLVGASEQAIRGKEAHVPVIAEAVRMFHEAGRPVVFILYDGLTHYMDRNTAEGDAIFEGIDARPDDIYVHKYHRTPSGIRVWRTSSRRRDATASFYAVCIRISASCPPIGRPLTTD